MAVYRILIKTHHMTSRKKIHNITKAAKQLSCRVLLKTGGPPGVMLAEGYGALEWMEVVRKLRYKDYRLLKKEYVESWRLPIDEGTVIELTSMKELGSFLAKDEELLRWWRVNMGYQSGDDTNAEG
ncbi:hypothetical protein B0O99DRAFT_510689 [Bisporella sp. PMI_857]|nr:hypothetical protein B0O99DRAFT_510689 [Bisporella sp. PMI_857]